MIVLPAVLLCAVSLLAAGALAFATNRRPVLSTSIVVLTSAGMAALIALTPGARLALLGVWLDFAQPFNVLGRALLLSELSRPAAAVVLASSALAQALAWRTPQGKNFVPLGAALTFFAFLALTARPFAYAAIAFLGAAVVGALLVQGDRAGPRSTLSSWRYPFSATLALAALFFASWLADRAARTAATDPEGAAVAYDVPTALALISFVLLLGAMPLYSWLHPAVKDAPPLGGALLGAVALGAAQLWALEVWRELDWLRSAPARAALSTTGNTLLTLAAVLAWAQRSPTRVIAAALFAEVGVGLVLMALDAPLAPEAMLFNVLARGVSLGALCLGLAVLGDPAARAADFRTRIRTWALGAVTLGGLSLAGMPGTVGFVSRWVTSRAISQTDLESLLLVLAAGVSVGVGVVRGSYALLAEPPIAAGAQAASSAAQGDDLRLRLTLASSMALVVALGLWPNALSPLLRIGAP